MGAYGSPELLPRIYPEGRRLKDTLLSESKYAIKEKWVGVTEIKI